MNRERLHARIGEASVKGWELAAVDGECAIMRRRTMGSRWMHLLVALLTVWWTFGAGNLVFAAYSYVKHTEYKVVAVPDAVSTTDAIERLRDLYARGEIDDAEFERRVTNLLAVETSEATS